MIRSVLSLKLYKIFILRSSLSYLRMLSYGTRFSFHLYRSVIVVLYHIIPYSYSLRFIMHQTVHYLFKWRIGWELHEWMEYFFRQVYGLQGQKNILADNYVEDRQPWLKHCSDKQIYYSKRMRMTYEQRVLLFLLCGQNTAILVTNSQQLQCLYWACKRMGLSIIRHEWRKPYPSLLNYLLLVDSRSGETLAFSYTLNDDFTRFQWTSNPIVTQIALVKQKHKLKLRTW